MDGVAGGGGIGGPAGEGGEVGVAGHGPVDGGGLGVEDEGGGRLVGEGSSLGVAPQAHRSRAAKGMRIDGMFFTVIVDKYFSVQRYEFFLKCVTNEVKV